MVPKFNMLKAVNIYYPGTGGNMLSRVLSLAPNAILATNGENPLEYETLVSAEEKMQRFLNWGGYNYKWKQREDAHKHSYRLGIVPFIKYEKSPLWLIEKLHPTEFYYKEQLNLWEKNNTFEHFIFTTVTKQDIKFVTTKQISKSYSVNYDIEHPLMCQLETRFADRRIDIPFGCFFSQNEFMDHIKKVDSQIGLDLDLDLAAQIWQKWYTESTKVWDPK